MEGILLQSKPYIEKRKKELKKEIENNNIIPKLLILRVGDDPASERYVNNKVKLGNEVGVITEVLHLENTISEARLINLIKTQINNREDLSGCLIQLPLPKNINENKVLEALRPDLDVDGFARENLGALVRGENNVVACTPLGIVNLLKYYNIPLEGKDVLIINRSNIVGKPLAMLMLQENATPIIAHSKTKNLFDKVKRADIVITAVGKAGFLDYGDFYRNQTIVDVSINFDENGKMCGDVLKEDINDLMEIRGCNITPVPGGVGPLTVLSLIENTIKLEKVKRKIY